MEQEYKDLLVRTVQAQETITSAITILKDNSKVMNDNLTSHNKTLQDIYLLSCKGNEISDANNKLLLKYLKWSIIALIIILGGTKLFSEVREIIGSYFL